MVVYLEREIVSGEPIEQRKENHGGQGTFLFVNRECSISSERSDPTVLKERRKQKRGEMEKSRVYYRMSRIPPREGLIFQPVEGGTSSRK